MVALRAAHRGESGTVATIRLSDTAGGNPASASIGEPGELDLHPSWPVDALRRFAASEVTTVQRWVRAMDAIAADDAKVWFTTTEVSERSGLTINEWRDAPRKITRHLAAHYPEVPRTADGELAWPLKAWSFGYEVSWAMTPATKSIWRELRGL